MSNFRRSFIFSPGTKPGMFPKALASGADIVCVELEDGIAPKDKAEARMHGLALFAAPQADDGVERILRINCLRTAFGNRTPMVARVMECLLRISRLKYTNETSTRPRPFRCKSPNA